MSDATKAADASVKLGVEWLDQHRPEWLREINPDTLDLELPCQCVLGQLEGNFYEAAWKAALSKAQTRALGFCAGAGVKYRSLTAAWKRAIRDRLSRASTSEEDGKP